MHTLRLFHSQVAAHRLVALKWRLFLKEQRNLRTSTANLWPFQLTLNVGFISKPNLTLFLDTHLAWTATEPPSPDKIGPLAIPLLADHNQSVSRHYGILQAEGNAQR